MKSVFSFGLTAIGGILIGAAMATLQAQGVSAPPAFLISDIEQITDQATFDKYKASAPQTEVPFGAHPLARGTALKVGDAAPPKGMVAIVQFPSMRALLGWWNSPAYAAVRPYRDKSTVGYVYAIEGLPAP